MRGGKNTVRTTQSNPASQSMMWSSVSWRRTHLAVGWRTWLMGQSFSAA